jgi:hypothetical protein
MKWWIVVIALAVNVVICYMALAPAYVTWVHAAPQYIKCSGCDSTEVQEALAAAVDVGHMHVVSVVRSFVWPIVALCLANLGLIVAAGWRGSSNKTMKPTR